MLKSIISDNFCYRSKASDTLKHLLCILCWKEKLCWQVFLFKVVDKSGKVGEFEDVSKVEKYEMAEDEYAKRTGKCLLLNFHGLLMQM